MRGLTPTQKLALLVVVTLLGSGGASCLIDSA